MTKTTRKKIIRLARAGGVIRAAEVEAAGIHRKHLIELTQDGTLERVGRGLYRLAGSPVTEHQSLVEASKAVPQGVICLLSALAFHRMTTQLPHEVWIAISREARRPTFHSLQLRVVQMSERGLNTDVEHHKLAGVEVRVFSKAKTVVDCFKWRKIVGQDVAIEALRDYLSRRSSKPTELMRLARICRVSSVMRPYMEALVG